MEYEAHPQLDAFTTLEAAQGIWPTVAERTRNLFATWEWASTWWRHFGSGRPMCGVIARRQDGQPAAILPLYFARRRPLAVLRFVGHGPGDWLGPIHAPEDSALTAAALRLALTSTSGWDLLLADGMRPEQRWPEHLDGAVVRREGFPILSFQGRTWSELLADRSSNFRQQVRRRERRLAREHKVTYRLSDHARLDSDLDLLFRLHEARWEANGAGVLGGTREAFHRDFARIALDRGWLRLWVMALDGAPAAAWYGFRFAGVEWYYQSGWDPSREAESVGFVMLCHTIRAALEDGVDEYMFLRGGEAYKYRFADRDPGLETVVVPRGLRGRAALRGIRHFDRMPAVVRRYLVVRAG